MSVGGRNRKESDARYRDTVRRLASEANMSVKLYRASRWPSAQWTYAIETIRRRCKKSLITCTITPADMANLWKMQNGICPITGWNMVLRKSGLGLTPKTVTVDRIDQRLGYIIDNVRLICFAANNARYVWDDKQLIDLCQAIVNKNLRDINDRF